MRVDRHPVPSSDLLGVGDQFRLEDVARDVGDSVSADSLLKNSKLLEVLRVGQTPPDRGDDGPANETSQTTAASCAAGAFRRVPQTELPRLGEDQEIEGLLVGQVLRVEVALGDEQERPVEVSDQLLMSRGPAALLLLEDEEGVDEEARVYVEDRVEPVVLVRSRHIEVDRCKHGPIIRRSADASAREAVRLPEPRSLDLGAHARGELVVPEQLPE
jgi:hypothetical protein